MLSKWEIVVNHMLLGEYTHTVDEKNRISLPSKFRKEVGKKVVITHGLDNCLFLYPLKEWEKFLKNFLSSVWDKQTLEDSIALCLLER